ncbi:YmdB family metallophosphoesterase [Oceanidesulfovibrio marinus]|uniref:Metallophosphoesterase n=1 Tax=Oceanidesulfovibrio marinus TaxID=370038 RepID=A0A6P1ZDG5_9BACT|nr:TIGR00282 family metallophosphoesterase [Oceanidesulfovibrio marinus]QJT08670.1 YmdB family metallophosphoesterase [Oceanidesulfovibrio marinus]TVM32494.1 metallophosphoesterase [Oceanidesulfovibrio marinus]
MRILFLGDVVGRPGRRAVAALLPALIREHDPALVVANGENAAGGLGMDFKTARQLFDAGVQVLTSGNHVWKIKDFYPTLDTEPRILRPANYPPGAPGRGMGVYAAGGVEVAVINLMGRTFMDDIDCPFRTVDALLDRLDARDTPVPVRLVDIHAEATSEKIALAYHLAGRVSAVLGTHTHVQTNDARILPGGTAALTDAGMCGVRDSALGMDPRAIIERFITGLPKRFTVASGEELVSGVWVDVDPETGRALDVGLVS